jgi:Mg/Co/Ni transporter MgtE
VGAQGTPTSNALGKLRPLRTSIIGLFAWWWFGPDRLGLVIAAAMVINLLAAALAGILIPLTLDHFDIDPAKHPARLSPR